jgi:hypothetical protein
MDDRIHIDTGGQQPKEQGIRKAARDLGVDRTQAQRAG